MGRTHLKAEPVSLLRENGQGCGVQDQEAVPLLLSVVKGNVGSQRTYSEGLAPTGGLHTSPTLPYPPTCDGRCCNLTLEAQMALPTAGRPHAVRSWVSLCCRLQGSSSSGAPWERGVRAGRQGGLERGAGLPVLTCGGAEWQRCGPPRRAICFSRWYSQRPRAAGLGQTTRRGAGSGPVGGAAGKARLAAHRRGPSPGPSQTPGLQLGGA